MLFYYGYFQDAGQRSVPMTRSLVAPGIEMVFGGDNSSIGHEVGAKTSARLKPWEFSAAAVAGLLASNDYVHVDEVKNETEGGHDFRCDHCAAVVSSLCRSSPVFCNRALFFFRMDPGDSPAAFRGDLLALAAARQVRKIFFETYRGAPTNAGPYVDAVNIGHVGPASFAQWSRDYGAWSEHVQPTVGLGNDKAGTYHPMNACPADMGYVHAVFTLIAQHVPWANGVAVYGASHVTGECAPDYSVADVAAACRPTRAVSAVSFAPVATHPTTTTAMAVATFHNHHVLSISNLSALI